MPRSVPLSVSVIFRWLSETTYVEMFFLYTAEGPGIGHVTRGGQCVLLYSSLPTCFPSLPPTDFKFSACQLSNSSMYIYEFFVEFAIKVSLWRSARHGYQCCVRRGNH